MEADWAVEIGAGAPWIDADWSGFVDLRAHPEAVTSIAEAPRGSALREMLLRLNAPRSHVFTSKCDLWTLASDDLDPIEYNSSLDEALHGVASWIDILPRDAPLFGSFQQQESWVRRIVSQLHTEPLANGRVDLVIRAAHAARQDGFALTLYAVGCGADSSSARSSWQRILRTAVNVTMDQTLWASSSIG